MFFNKIICPNCNANLKKQFLFDERKRVNICDNCKTVIINPNCCDQYVWYCNKCDDIMNNQESWLGETNDLYQCEKCGAINDLSDPDSYEFWNSKREYYENSYISIFDENLTFTDFKQLAISVAKPIKRLFVRVENTHVIGNVKTNSGLDEWGFIIDFKNYIINSGKYKIVYLGNNGSKIPYYYAEQLSKAIKEHLNDKTKKYRIYYCSKCGELLNKQKKFIPITWDFYECYNCGNIFYNIDYICPCCNSILNNQKTFSPLHDQHKCENCGKVIYADD